MSYNFLCQLFRSYTNKTGKMRPFFEAIAPLVPVLTFLALGTVWVIYSPLGIVDVDPRCLYFVTGTIFSNICVRLNFFLALLTDWIIEKLGWYLCHHESVKVSWSCRRIANKLRASLFDNFHVTSSNNTNLCLWEIAFNLLSTVSFSGSLFWTF